MKTQTTIRLYKKAVTNILFATAFFVLPGCSILIKPEISVTSFSENPVEFCQAFFSEFDQHVSMHNIQDVQSIKLAKYPFLRFNRFLEGQKEKLNTTVRTKEWISLAASESRVAQQFEWQNLPANSQSQLKKSYFPNDTFRTFSARCTNKLISAIDLIVFLSDLSVDSIPDDYSSLKRVLGIYPITSLVVSHQIEKHQRQVQKLFNTELDEIPVSGEIVRYQNSQSLNNSMINFKPEYSALGIPLLNDEKRRYLFEKYSPVLDIDVVDNNDRIGMIKLDSSGNAIVNTKKPLVYHLDSLTQLGENVLLQLNYVFWFPARPPLSAMDIYSGNLDGIIWRVTLDTDLQPLLFESVHSCGCYHKFFPTQKLQPRSAAIEAEREPPFIAQKIDFSKEHYIARIRIDSVRHFVNRVYFAETPQNSVEEYNLESYQSLRSLPWKDGLRRSLFSNTGLIAGTERAERWLLWPMGVDSAGAMRQWGHHAVAFVGRRHFDDSDLLDRFFKRQE